MARSITTDTFLTITGPGINIRVSRALVDASGKVAVWTRPHGAPQHIFQLLDARKGLQMRGTLLTLSPDDGADDGAVVTYRRRGVSCSWAICKGKFTTRQVSAWWRDDDATDPAPAVAARPSVAQTAQRRAAVTTASERRAARARARAARASRATVAARRADPPTPAPVEEPEEEETTEDPATEDPATEDPAAAERVTTYALNPPPDPPPDPATDPATDPTPLTELTIRQRLVDALVAANITTISDLAAETPESLADINGIGPKALAEIADLLASRETGRRAGS